MVTVMEAFRLIGRQLTCTMTGERVERESNAAAVQEALLTAEEPHKKRVASQGDEIDCETSVSHTVCQEVEGGDAEPV